MDFIELAGQLWDLLINQLLVVVSFVLFLAFLWKAGNELSKRFGIWFNKFKLKF